MERLELHALVMDVRLLKFIMNNIKGFYVARFLLRKRLTVNERARGRKFI
jgi:hypothetical protein